MFYPGLHSREEISLDEQRSYALVVLTSAESKRLIAKAIARLPEVRRALHQGRVIIANGTTNAYVVEELVGTPLPKASYAAGIITRGELRIIPGKDRLKPVVLIKGERVDLSMNEALQAFSPEDVFIKGANAIDMQGNAGILLGSEVGGTIGQALPILAARGCQLIVPAGLEKLIPSVIEASQRCGTLRFKRATGVPVGFMPLVNARVVAEIQALEVLAGLEVIHVASGGVGGSEGSVVLALEGKEETVARAFELVEAIKGEAAVVLGDLS